MTRSKALLIAGIFAVFSSCSGQGAADGAPQSEQPQTIGKTVSTLDKRVLHIFQDSKRNYWFAANDQGAYKYDGKTLVLYTEDDGLCGKDIIGIEEDKFGNIYFDTWSGVSKFDGQQFTTLEVSHSTPAEADWKLTPDDLWFRMGIGGTGPYRYDGTSLHHLELPKTERVGKFYAINPNASFSPFSVYTTYRDRSGNMWFGTSSLGAFRFDGKSVRWLYEEQLQTTPHGGDFGTRSIMEDKDGHFWFNNPHYRYQLLPDSTKSHGASQFRYKRKKGVATPGAENENDVPYFLTVAEDDSGNIWGATYANGVWKNTGTELIHYPVEDGETEVLLFFIYADTNGEIWLGTHNAGVFRFNGTAFEKFVP